MTLRRKPIAFKSTDRPLRRDVRLLGRLVGAMLREQGAGLFERVEGARKAAIARREGDGDAEARLAGTLSGLSAKDAAELVRAFSTYFLVVNLAEKIHRIRRRRDFLREPDGPPQPGSLRDALVRLTEARPGGWTEEEIASLVRDLRIEPVFTAHPTEATRRAILAKEQRIARHLVARLNPARTVPEEASLRARIREEITAAWQTEEHPGERPTVADEREHVLFFVTDVLYRIVPALLEELEDAVRDVTGRAVEAPPVLAVGSWVGGDMDGNPNVTAATIAATLDRHRELALGLYAAECRSLADRLTQSPTRVDVHPAILEAPDVRRRLFPDDPEDPPRARDLPYRLFLGLAGRRLEAAKAGDERGYRTPEAFDRDLQLLTLSLAKHRGDHAGLHGVTRLRRRLAVFGFHLATLDVRQDALVHRLAAGKLLHDPGWADRPSGERTARLSAILANGSPPSSEIDDETRTTLDVFRAIRAGRARAGARALGPFIISMTHDVDDVLTVLALDHWSEEKTGAPVSSLDVCPLFETVGDLQAAPEILARLLADPVYAAHLERRGNRQYLMIGYSDSGKDGGIVASRRAIETAQEGLVAAAEAAGVVPVFFHGRGGTIGRGGGRIHRAVLASPRGSVNGTLRLTEQGESIDERYGLRGIATRNLERMMGAALTATAREREPAAARPDRAIPDLLAVESRRAWRALVHDDPRFYDYFRHATPIDVIERMTIGSRPASRRSRRGIGDLRAIPWVFSWVQSRHHLPGWFGFGTGLRAVVDRFGVDAVIRHLGEDGAFENLVNDVETDLARADLEIAARYAALAPEAVRPVLDLVRREYEEAVALLLAVRGADRLLAHAPTLRRSIRLRNPYVDPMSLLQVDLLRRWRAGERKDEALFHALLSTVNGIAGGLQSTG